MAWQSRLHVQKVHTKVCMPPRKPDCVGGGEKGVFGTINRNKDIWHGVSPSDGLVGSWGTAVAQITQAEYATDNGGVQTPVQTAMRFEVLLN